MFQTFNTNTLMSRFIKSLLASQALPLLDFVTVGDIIIEGCTYIYKQFIIRCYKTGVMFVEDNDMLYPSDNLYPSVVLYPATGEQAAKFKVLSIYNDQDSFNYTYKYNSPVHWYDEETHKHLGNYLRYLKYYKNLDLFPFYNCCTSKELYDVSLLFSTTEPLYPSEELFPENALYPGSVTKRIYDGTSLNYSITPAQGFRVLAVPIKFGKQYTVALQCSSRVLLRSVIYGSSGMVKQSSLSDTYYSDLLNDSYMYRSHANFNEPFLYSVQTSDKRLYERQQDLYLLIQIPSTCTTSVTVLEGNYTNIGSITAGTNSVRNHTSSRNLNLLKMNSKTTYAFSDRLIEYLLLNVITHQDEITSNIQRVQQQLYRLDGLYRDLVNSNKVCIGVWDDEIRNSILRLVDKYSEERFLSDQDGYINKDIEQLLYSLKG